VRGERHETHAQNPLDAGALVPAYVLVSPGSEVAVMEQSQKLRVYETLHSLNEAFEQILTDFRHLQEFPFFNRESLRHFQVVVEETRAWANFDVAEVMHSREQSDWARFGGARQQWEKRFADPDDVLIEADKRKQELRKAARKRRGRGANHE